MTLATDSDRIIEALPDKWRVLIELGFSVIPIPLHSKQPAVKWKPYQMVRADASTVTAWAAKESNIGIATGRVSGLIVLDLDSEEAMAEADRRGLPDTIAVKTAKGLHYYFAHPGGDVGNRAGIFPGTDIRGDGGYVVAPGSIHETGVEYEWHNPPGLFDLAPMPDWLATALANPKEQKKPDTDNVDRETFANDAYAEKALDNELSALRNAGEGQRNDRLNTAAFNLAQLAAGGVLDGVSCQRHLRATALAIGLSEAETDSTIASGWLAGSASPRRPEPNHRARTSRESVSQDQNAEASEDAIALAFTAKYRDRLKYDHDVGCWFSWTATHWQPDGTHLAFDYARQLGRELSGGKRALSKAAVAAGAERFAQADRAHAVDASIWDADPMLLGTPSGTIDLATGELNEPDPGDYITKQTGVAPEHGEPTLWLKFLNESLSGDAEAIKFVQQWCGYCLTGETREHALAFVYGPGGNGKSVFLNALIAIMGDYAVTAAMETFTASRNDRHSTELAMLRGARLVSASETEEGRAWAEARVKALTGGDPVTARFMRQDNFTFTPQFKLTIAGNHAPALRNVDDAMKRRFNILPFVNKPTNPDPLLDRKLRAEHGKILAWAIAGARDWNARGLSRPEIVQVATDDYFDNQDLFGQWIEEKCSTGESHWEQPTPLYKSWAEYAVAAGDDPGTQRGLSDRLRKRGFVRGKTGGLKVYRGLSVKQTGPFDE